MAEGSYCPINDNIRHRLHDSNLRAALIKNHLSEPEFLLHPTGLNRDGVNSGLFFGAQLLSGNEFTHNQQLKINIDSSIFRSTGVSTRSRRWSVFFGLACHCVSFDLSLRGWQQQGSFPSLMETWVVMLSDGNRSLRCCLGVCWAYEQRVRMDQWLLRGLMGTDRQMRGHVGSSRVPLFPFYRGELFDRVWQTSIRQGPSEIMKSAFGCH